MYVFLAVYSYNIIFFSYYHGVYSTMELPGVHYEYIKGVKWRRTIYDGCGHLGAITTLYYALHATWGMFLLVALVTCGVALAGSVCASQVMNIRLKGIS